MRTGQTFLARGRCIESSQLFSPILLGDTKGSWVEIHSFFFCPGWKLGIEVFRHSSHPSI